MTRPYCERLRSRFDDYHDGLLSPFLTEVVRRHLQECASCREEYGLLERCIGVRSGLSCHV